MNDLLEQAEQAYQESFDGQAWLGRCIFLSFYCERGTCDFCFRSVAKHQEKHAHKARRSLPSILAEALLIKAFDWRIEFLTGGYGILDDEELMRTIKLVSQALDQKIWVNIGTLTENTLKKMQPYVEGIVASIETTNPELHREVCPDKPIEPYEEMLTRAKALGYKRSVTIIIGLGEKREDFELLKTFIEKHELERITIYALRPVKGTRYEQGPAAEDVAWWIARTRTAFPRIEIIAGSAEYRRAEIPQLLRAGANAITKLPATKIFNKETAREIEQSIRSTGRTWTSKLTHPNPQAAIDWEAVEELEIADEERASLKRTLQSYLEQMTTPQNASSSQA